MWSRVCSTAPCAFSSSPPRSSWQLVLKGQPAASRAATCCHPQPSRKICNCTTDILVAPSQQQLRQKSASRQQSQQFSVELSTFSLSEMDIPLLSICHLHLEPLHNLTNYGSPYDGAEPSADPWSQRLQGGMKLSRGDSSCHPELILQSFSCGENAVRSTMALFCMLTAIIVRDNVPSAGV